MKIIQCEKGHSYDGDKYAICPHCAEEKVQRPAGGSSLGSDHGTGSQSGGIQEDRTVLLDDEKTVLLSEGSTVFLGDAASEREDPAAQEPPAEQETPAVQGEQRLSEEEAGRLYREASENRCLNCMCEYDTEKFGICPYCGFERGTLPAAAYHLHPGMGLSGRYVIGTVLGFGGFGITYKAWDSKLKAVVAIKEYYPSGIVNRIPGEKAVILYTGTRREEFRKGLTRFLEEARYTVKFNSHPNIVHVFDYFEENGTAYMVMELLQGVSLQKYMEQCGGRVPWKEAVSIISFVAEAVREIHSRGIIHRDLSPDNIFICQDGTVKLMDLGAARFSNEEDDAERTVILKIGLAPPEQYYRKGKQGPWTDVYALAATLYWTVTGCEPEESTDREREDHLAGPRALIPDIPEYLDRMILRGMALLPELRFKDMIQFKKALLNEDKVLEVRQEIEKRKKRRGAGIAVSLLLLAAAAGAGFHSYSERRAEAFLEDTAITAWFPLRDGQAEEEGREIWEGLVKEFEEAYPHVQVDVTFVPEAQYAEKLERSLSEGETEPTLFESAGLGDGQMALLAPVSGALELLNPEDYYFLSDYKSYFPDEKQLPLGFHVAVYYGNRVLAADTAADGTGSRMEAFLSQDTPACISDTSRFYEVQAALPGIYSMRALPDGRSVGAFDHLWSVNGAADEPQRQAAVRLLYYFLSENAQDVFHLSHQGSMPLMKSQLKVYLEVNQEFTAIEDGLEELKLLDEAGLESAEEEIYEEMRDSGAWRSYLEENTKE